MVPGLALPRHLPGFTYRVPATLKGRLRLGDVVRVPFRSRTIDGVIWSLTPPLHPPPTRWVAGRAGWSMPDAVRSFLDALAVEFLASPAAVLRLNQLPKVVRTRNGVGTYLAYLAAPDHDTQILSRAAGNRPALVVASGPTAVALRSVPSNLRLGSDAALLDCREAGLTLLVYREEATEHRRRTAPFFDARRAAVLRGQHFGAPVVFTARCPRVETMAGIRDGTIRVLGAPPALPAVHTLTAAGWKDPKLVESLEESFGQGGSAFVWVPSRGLAAVLVCGVCGWVARCARCGVPQRVRDPRTLVCGSCAAADPLPAVCPRCGAMRLTPRALGTTGVRRLLETALPRLPVALLTANDPLPPPAFRGILIGTHAHLALLPRYQVRCAVVAGLERFLAVPDFRAEERFAQRLTDLRFALPPGSRLLLLGVDPAVLSQWTRDPRERVTELIDERRTFRYPPAVRLALLTGRSAIQVATGFSRRSGVVRVDVLEGGVPRALLRIEPSAWASLAPELTRLSPDVTVEPDPDGFGV